MTVTQVHARWFHALLFVFVAGILFSSCFTGVVNSRIDRIYGKPDSNMNIISASENVNGTFPDRIYIKTATQTFNQKYYFLLDRNRIYYKSIDPSGDVPEWERFGQTGLPSSRLKPDFVKPSAIIAIAADANELQAMSNTGRIYQFVFDPGYLIQDYFWKDRMGWPNDFPLVVNDLVRNFRSWSIGKRNASVLWYEDRYGNQHHYGTMGIETSYFLCRNGQDIRFSDTGLPSDFSRMILGPERGQFVAESLSASASTMFVINDSGEMYTRLADFDTLGCDPLFFKYTYLRENYGIPGSNYLSNATPWALPSENWKKQPRIPIEGKARISSRITILLTGQGNAARELRVAGLDRTGRTGYYFKSLNDESWHFSEAPLRIAEEDFLDNRRVASGDATSGPSSDAAYAGRIWFRNVPVSDIALEIPNFNLGEGSCNLVITYDGESARIIMHPVEAWTYFRRYDPGRDSTAKLFLVTLEIPEGAFDSASPAFKKILNDLFAETDRKLFEFAAEATTDYIFIRQSSLWSNDLSFFFTRSGVITEMNPDFFRKIAIGKDSVIQKFQSEELVLPAAGKTGEYDPDTVAQFLDRNVKFKETLQDHLDIYKSYKISSSISGQTYSIFNALTHVTFLFLLDFPKIYTVTRHGSVIMRNNAQNANFMSDAKCWMYEKVMELLDIRIEMYREILVSLKAKQPHPARAASFSETFSGYYHQLGIPDLLEGIWHYGSSAIPCRISAELFADNFPALMVIPQKKSSEVFLIDFKNLPQDVFNLSADHDFALKPFTTTVNVVPLVIPGEPISKAGSSFQKAESAQIYSRSDETATLEWNGSVLTIYRQLLPPNLPGRLVLFSSARE